MGGKTGAQHAAENTAQWAQKNQAAMNSQIGTIQQGYVNNINQAAGAAGAYKPTQTAGYNALDTLSDLLGISRPTAGYATYNDQNNPNTGYASKGTSAYTSNGNAYANASMLPGNIQLNANPNYNPAGYSGGWTDPTQSSQAALNALKNTPGYQFSLDQGNQAIQRQMNANGLWGSGNMAQSMSEYNQKLAGETYQNAIQNYSNMVNAGNTATTAANTQLNAATAPAAGAMTDLFKTASGSTAQNAWDMSDAAYWNAFQFAGQSLGGAVGGGGK